jgi:CIC family chloride channel protein
MLWQEPLSIPDGLAGTFFLGPRGIALIIAIPALGGLAVGLIAKYACGEAAGGGTGEILRSYHRGGAQLPGRLVPFKWLASCLTLGTGGAGGNEGPAALIGSATGSWLARRLNLSASERGLLFSAGIAAGVGAIFRAPLGGALFACEMYYSSSEFESDALLPSLTASVCAYFLFGLFLGYQPLLPGDTVFTLSLVNFAALGAMALICAIGARAYVAWMDLCSRRMKAALPQPWRPAMGGLMVGGLALGLLFASKRWLGSDARVLSVLGEGYPILNSAVLAQALPLLLILVAVGKLLASGLTVGSGGSAGVFAPSMIIGGCLGALVFLGLHALGCSDGDPKAYVLAGMAAFFAAGTACPLASIIIITEVAQGYHLLPALMWVVALAYLLRPRPCLFKDQAASSVDSPMHRDELQSDFLASRTVGQLCRNAGAWDSEDKGCLPLRADQILGEAVRRMKAEGLVELPVVDRQGRFIGLFAYGDMVSFEAK